MKTCIKCKIEKEEEQFPFQSYRRSDGTRARKTVCKTCENRRRDERRKKIGVSESRRNAQNRKSSNYYHGSEEVRANTYLKNRRHMLKNAYGITLEDYQKMLDEQDCKCKICSKPAEECVRGILDVDHCHRTGKIRGLLCTDCNNLLGRAKDSVQILQNAMIYLELSK
jgi:hypothetical protein